MGGINKGSSNLRRIANQRLSAMSNYDTLNGMDTEARGS